jgi:predicted ATPase
LGPLSRQGILDLLHQLTGQAGGERFAERLYWATGGNPLFVSETLRYLFDQGWLRVDPSGWHTPVDQTTQDYGELPLPPSLSGAVLARLQRLGSGALVMAQALALVDAPVGSELLPNLLDQENVRLDDLEALLAAGLVREASDGYVLRHQLVRAAVLEQLPPARRAWLHLRLGEALKLGGADPARYARHFEAGGNREETAQAHLAAARNLRRSPLVRQALSHYHQALELMNPSAVPAERFRVLAESAELALSLGDAVAGLAELAELAERLGSHELFRVRLLQAEGAVRSGAVALGIRAAQDALNLAQTPWQRGHALFSLSWLHYRGGDPEAQLELLQEAIRCFRELGDAYMEAFALRNLSGYHARLGEIATFEAVWEQTYSLAAELQDPLLLRRLKADKANLDWVRGRYAQSHQAGAELLQEARKSGDLWAVWDALHLLLLNAMALGLSTTLESEARAALHEAHLVEALRDEAMLRSDLGQVLLTENRLDEAAQAFESALKALEQIGEQASLGHTLFGYGYTLVELGQIPEGLVYLRRATELWERRREWRNSARTLAVTSLALNRIKQHDESLRLARLALERLEPWAEGLYDSALIHYAYARALGNLEGRSYLIKAQTQLRTLAQQLPAEESGRFLRNRFVRWALDKPV